MRLLITPNEREKEFKRLMNSYSEYYWASAWASIDFDCFDMLKKYREKIKKIIIGISFDHTHPEFIKTFIDDKKVKFFKQPNEIFHPKIYLFQNSIDEWEVLIGSMNFTSAGFYENVEALILISNKDGSDTIYREILELINTKWEISSYFNEEELREYNSAFKNQQKRFGEYGKNKPGKPINRVKIMNLSWQEFVKRIYKDDKYNSLEGRLDLLNRTNELFKKYLHFNAMSDNDRKKLLDFGKGKMKI